jgi:hypothetical protein
MMVFTMPASNFVRHRAVRPRKGSTVFKYVILYDNDAGRRDRYTLLALSSGDPFIIGRELPMGHCKRVIKELERFAPEDGWFGDRETLEQCYARYQESRRKA